MRKTPGGRKRSEDAYRKIHEYFEKKLVAEHGETDERERPGITGSKTEVVQAAEAPDTPTQAPTDRQTDEQTDGRTDRPSDMQTDGPTSRRTETDRQTGIQIGRQTGRPADRQTDRHTDRPTDRIQNKDESTTRSRVPNKRPAEEEADDSNRGDRVDWRNFVEPSSSSQAPSPLPLTVEARPTGSAGEPGGDNVISDVVATTPVASSGTKRPQDEHAMMDYDGMEVETKTQRISSICFGIASDDITGEINAVDYDEELKGDGEQIQSGT